MKVLVIADTHLPRGRRRLPEALLERLRRADHIVHAGDVNADSVLRELEEYAPLTAVAGNADEPALRQRLPTRTSAMIGGLSIGVIHDAGSSGGREERLVAAFPGCAAIVYGHTHVPQVERHHGVWILNPGSPTERRRAPRRTFLDLEVRNGTLSPKLVQLR
jgi:hypothetical protein